MRFDVRDKKPKLYHLLALTVFTAAAIALLSVTGFSAHVSAINVILCIYFALALFLLVFTAVRQLQYNPYSYNTIFYIGFSLFLLFVLGEVVYLTVMSFREPELYNGRQITHYLSGTGSNYILLTFPFIFIFSVALVISNISLIRHEGYRFVNILGILLSVLMVGAAVFLYFFDFMVSGSELYVMIHEMISSLLTAVYLYFECMLIGAGAAALIAARHEPEKNKDFVIILGCRMRKDGTPTPLLKGRCDRALHFYRKQLETTGKELTFITSGGQGANEPLSESACMKQYLLSQGVPERLIVEEDRSTNTFENMTFSKVKIDAADPAAKVAFSTTNYHVFRSGLYARRVKLRAVRMGARTKWYFWPNAAVREFVGLLQGHRLKQVLILSGLVLFYVLLTLINYLVLV